MGVHDLWSIVEPVRESVPLYSLSGKTLAVDLSLWVCEAQHVQAMMGRVTRPHLRNLFFRVSSLTLMGVKLVFVMEGEAPKLKADTMSQRTEKRFGGPKKATPVATAAPKRGANPSRGRFKAVLRECSEMLDALGLPWVTAAGEAEAACAYLDAQGLVDGCITNDGDAFLYGARTVYRNFNINSKDPQVDCYRTSRVETELHLSRENMVGLAILLGCDYIPKGVAGVGREQALRLMGSLKGQTLLQKFTQWKEEKAGVSEGVVKKVPHCHICRHPGSAKAHERGGCDLCDSRRFCQPQDFDYQCPCQWHRGERSRQAAALEANVRKKTLANQLFPFTEIIREFLVSKDQPASGFRRRQPNLLSMQNFALDKMEWPKHYTSEKVLVLMTYAELMNRKHGREVASQIRPLRIWKARVRNGVACYEVVWSPPDHYVFPEDRGPGEAQGEVRSVEEEALFAAAFPMLVERYRTEEELKTKRKKPKSKKEKTSDGPSDLSDILAQMSLQSAAPSQDATGPSPVPPPPPPPPAPDARIPEVIIVDTPTSLKHQHRPAAAATTSPSVSAAIEALHLSDIDWDATSFSASPPPPPDPAAPKVVRQANVSSELPDAECPLRERVLLRNAARAQDRPEMRGQDVSKPLGLGHGGATTSDPSSSQDLKPAARESPQQSSYVAAATAEEKKTLAEKVDAQTRTSKPRPKAPAPGPGRKVDACRDPQKPRKYKSVKVADPAPAKRSVCHGAGSSSEDSDVENRQRGRPRSGKAKTKGGLPRDVRPGARTAFGLPPDIRLKPVRAPPSVDPVAHRAPLLGPRCLQQDPDVGTDGGRSSRDVPPPASPVVVSDSEDSVVCGDSPLPLAERLRLKFLS